MRRLATLSATTAIGALLVASNPATVAACTSDQPTFAEAVRDARAIARVTLIEEAGSESHSETYRVERVLKGALPEVITLSPAWTTLCHDTVGYYVGDEGAVVVLAIDVPFDGQIIHPVWGVDRGKAWGSADVPNGLGSLADLEAAIRSKLGLPDTATLGPVSPRLWSHSVPAVLVTILALGVSLTIVTERHKTGRTQGR